MANLFDWNRTEDPRDIVHVTVQALVEGHLVVLPTETAYHVFASGLHADAVQRLASVADRGPIALFVRSGQEARDYAPSASKVALRMAERGWPNPLVLELPAGAPDGLVARLPEAVQSLVLSAEGFVPLRVTAHQAVQHALRLMPGPLVGAPLPVSDAATQPSIPPSLSGEVACIVDAGAPSQAGPATRVRVEENRCLLLHPGSLPADKLAQFAQMIVLFVCTGNTCRSPMAETLFRKLVDERFPELRRSELPPLYVGSAGISAFPGATASEQAHAVMQQRGLSLVDHQSRPLTERAVEMADRIYTMTRSHRDAILHRLPQHAAKVELLSPDGEDVSDPFGGPQPVYAACADQIEAMLRHRLEDFCPTDFPMWSRSR